MVMMPPTIVVAAASAPTVMMTSTVMAPPMPMSISNSKSTPSQISACDLLFDFGGWFEVAGVWAAADADISESEAFPNERKAKNFARAKLAEAQGLDHRSVPA
jgi:hypothetical protein